MEARALRFNDILMTHYNTDLYNLVEAYGYSEPVKLAILFSEDEVVPGYDMPLVDVFYNYYPDIYNEVYSNSYKKAYMQDRRSPMQFYSNVLLNWVAEDLFRDLTGNNLQLNGSDSDRTARWIYHSNATCEPDFITAAGVKVEFQSSLSENMEYCKLRGDKLRNIIQNHPGSFLVYVNWEAGTYAQLALTEQLLQKCTYIPQDQLYGYQKPSWNIPMRMFKHVYNFKGDYYDQQI